MEDFENSTRLGILIGGSMIFIKAPALLGSEGQLHPTEFLAEILATIISPAFKTNGFAVSSIINIEQEPTLFLSAAQRAFTEWNFLS